MLRDQIREDIEKQVSRMVGKRDSGVEVTRTSDPRFGDYTTNVALRLGTERQRDKETKGIENTSEVGSDSSEVRENKQSPLETARILADSLRDLPYVSKLEVAGPGFINFWIKPSVWQKEISKLLEAGQFAQSRHSGKRAKRSASRIEKDRFWTSQNDSSVGKKIIIEFTDPNPFKEFHIGHLYSNIVGESLARLKEAMGAKVARANYQGDVGVHVAKAIWGILQKSKVKSQK